MSRFVIEPLGPKYDRAAFSFGVEILDAYLKKQAGQDQKKRGCYVRAHAGWNDRIQVLLSTTGRNFRGSCEKTAEISDGASDPSRPVGRGQCVSRARARGRVIDGCTLSNSSA